MLSYLKSSDCLSSFSQPRLLFFHICRMLSFNFLLFLFIDFIHINLRVLNILDNLGYLAKILNSIFRKFKLKLFFRPQTSLFNPFHLSFHFSLWFLSFWGKLHIIKFVLAEVMVLSEILLRKNIRRIFEHFLNGGNVRFDVVRWRNIRNWRIFSRKVRKRGFQVD